MKWWKTYRILKHKRKQLRASPEEIRRWRLSKLRNLLTFAYQFSPFYRQYYKQHGVHPEQIHSEDDLKKLPVLDKASLRQADPLQVITVGAESGSFDERNLIVDFTSGSTGTPLKLLRTWRDLSYIKANDIRAFQQTGFRFYHRQVVLKSSSDTLTGKHWFERLGVLRKYWLSIIDPPEKNLKKLQEIRPRHIHGYPSGLLTLAEVLEAQRQKFPIPIICTGAEVLGQSIRGKIQEAFEAEVFDLYGTRELGNIAWECRAHQGLHLNDDAMIVELLDEDGKEVPDGQEGEVIVTHLDAYDYPFIRYALGDRAIRRTGLCPCGVKFSRFDVVTGRSDERILLPSGEWISGMVFQELRTVPWLSAFRIVQDEPGSVRLQVVPRSVPEGDQLEVLVTQASDLTQGKLNVIPELLDRLDRDEPGKVRAVICRLPIGNEATLSPKRARYK